MKELDQVLERGKDNIGFGFTGQSIADLQAFEEVHLATETSDLKVDDYPHIKKWYGEIFEQDLVKEYHKKMVDALNEIYPENRIKFTEV